MLTIGKSLFAESNSGKSSDFKNAFLLIALSSLPERPSSYKSVFVTSLLSVSVVSSAVTPDFVRASIIFSFGTPSTPNFPSFEGSVFLFSFYRMKKKGLKGRTIEITIRTKDMENTSRHRQLGQYTNITDEIATQAFELFRQNYRWHKPVRSLGIRMTDLVDINEPEQLSLFVNEDNRNKHRDMDKTVDSIREKFGYDVIKRGIMYLDSDKKRG